MSDTLPLARIVHTIPGRARLRIDSRRGDGAFFAALATGLSIIPGVSRADVRPLTGSVLIEHNGPLERVIAAAAQKGLFVVARASTVAAAAPPATFDPKVAMGVGLGVFALWQLAQGRVLPPAVTLAWYAANLTGLLTTGDVAEAGE
jgi:hypothetical protein